MAYRDDYEGGGYIPEEPQGPVSDPFADQLTALYAKYGRGAPDAASLQAHRGNPGGLAAIEEMLIRDQPHTPPETGGGGPGPDLGGGGGYVGGGGGGSIGSLIAPFTGQAPSVPSGTGYLPQTPQFRAPGYTPPPAFSYESFKGPDAESVLSDPGYKFRLNQGEQALQQSAAARGVLNGGGTLKDILGYGQDFASQEYGNVWNRDLGAYQTNRNNAFGNYMANYTTQYSDPYAHSYQAALDEFAPQMTAYSTQAQAGQRASELNYNNLWNQYLNQYDQFRDQRDSTFDKQFKVADA